MYRFRIVSSLASMKIVSIGCPSCTSSRIIWATAAASKNSPLRASTAMVTVRDRVCASSKASIRRGSIIGGILSMQKLPLSSR